MRKWGIKMKLIMNKKRGGIFDFVAIISIQSVILIGMIIYVMFFRVDPGVKKYNVIKEENNITYETLKTENMPNYELIVVEEKECKNVRIYDKYLDKNYRIVVYSDGRIKGQN